jgi:hypothetical protein
VRSCPYIFYDDAFKIATGNSIVIKEYIIAVMGKVLLDRHCPGYIRAAIADKNRFFNSRHRGSFNNDIGAADIAQNNAYQKYSAVVRRIEILF